MPRSAPGAMRLIVVLVLASYLAPVPGLVPKAIAAEGNSNVHGTIYEPDESAKLAGAKVTAINVKTGKQYASNVTSDNGDFEVVGLPAGTYDIAIEIGGSIFVADNLVDLTSGQSLGVSYSVQPLRPANRKLAGLHPPQGSATPVGGFHGTGPAAGTVTGGGRQFWTSTGGILLLGALSAGAGYAIAHNRNKNNASPSMP